MAVFMSILSIFRQVRFEYGVTPIFVVLRRVVLASFRLTQAESTTAGARICRWLHPSPRHSLHSLHSVHLPISKSRRT